MKKLLIIVLLLAALVLPIVITHTANITQPKARPQTAAAAVPDPMPEEKLLKGLTLDEKIGQLVIVGFQKDTKEQDIKSLIEKNKVGGFILFKRNYESFEEMYKLSAKLKGWNSSNPLPLFLSADEEGGTVSRLPQGGTKFPDARLVGLVDDTKLTEKMGVVIGRELSAGGINVDFAPVLDIVQSESNKLLIKRSFGSSPELVARQGSAFIKGLRSQNIIAAAKHFPGHGDTNTDSHGKLPVIKADKNTMLKRELAPFKSCMAQGLDAVMVGHLAFPRVDPSGLPATKSKVFLTDILRKEMGFQGLAITDEIEMYGFMNDGKNLEDSIIQAFNAGVDVFVIGHTRSIQDTVISALKKGVTEGKISQQRLDESVLRIIRIKLKYKLTDKMPYDYTAARKLFGSKENLEVLNKLKLEILRKTQ